jgi:hypothetical protein
MAAYENRDLSAQEALDYAQQARELDMPGSEAVFLRLAREGRPTSISPSIHPQAKGLAIASMVLGICSLVLGWVPILGFILAVLAVVFGARRLKHQEGRGMAVTGFVTGVVGVFLFVLILALVTNQ